MAVKKKAMINVSNKILWCWGALFVSLKSTTVILEIQELWHYRHAGREQLSKTCKSWQMNSCNASTCAESLISCVLVRDLQGVNLSPVDISNKRSVSQNIQNYASTSRSENLCYSQAKNVSASCLF